MKNYSITIEELVCQDFSVDTETKEEAVRKAMELYRRGELVLSPGNLEMKRIRISEDGERWIEF